MYHGFLIYIDYSCPSIAVAPHVTFKTKLQTAISRYNKDLQECYENTHVTMQLCRDEIP